MKKKYLYFLISLSLIIFFILFLLLSPWLNIKEIEVNGIKRIEKSQIIRELGLENETNLLAFSKIKAKFKLKKNNYIKNVKIKKIFPNKIIFNIEERELAGYIPYINDYLYIDKDGFLVDIKPNFTENLPIIEGLVFDKFILGTTLEVEDKDAFKVVMKFTKALAGKEITKNILKIDVSNLEDIHLSIKGIDVVFGNGEDINIKVNTLIEIFKKIPDNQKGILYINDINLNPVLKLIT